MRHTSLLLVALALSACSQPTPPPVSGAPSQPPVSSVQPAAQQPAPAPAEPGTAAAPAAEAPKPNAELEAKAKALAEAGQAAMRKASASYSMFRQQLTRTGWEPSPQGACAQNVPRPDAAQLCDALPELNSCTAEGSCRMIFQRTQPAGTETLHVLTSGPLEDWNVGENSRLTIRNMVMNPRMTPTAK